MFPTTCSSLGVLSWPCCHGQGTHNVANLAKIMTRIGGVCLITIGAWCIIELAVQFGHYGHGCKMGEGEAPASAMSCLKHIQPPP